MQVVRAGLWKCLFLLVITLREWLLQIDCLNWVFSRRANPYGRVGGYNRMEYIRGWRDSLNSTRIIGVNIALKKATLRNNLFGVLRVDWLRKGWLRKSWLGKG
jgi:hypothetical protein